MTSANNASSRSHSMRYLMTAALVLLLGGCQTVPPAPKPTPTPPPVAARAQYTPAPWADLPGWSDDAVAAAWPAFLVGCRALVARAKSQAVWRAPCAAAEGVDGTSNDAVRAFFTAHFSPYRIAAEDGNDVGLVTGYYEPVLEGSRTPTAKYGVALYGPPDDLLVVDLASLFPELKDKRVRGRVEGRKVVPYWTRGELERDPSRLAGKALAYVADPVEAFFLEIQGSGRIALADGTVMRLNYADQNGQPYRSVGRVLIDRGELTRERASMQAIRAWVHAHPDEMRALLDENPSYVFFREVPPAPAGSVEAAIDGPLGSLGVPLLAQRTIAVDPRFVPLGAPVYLATTMPLSEAPLQRLTLAQDTGGAIRGPVRADFFWGFGTQAGREAGRMRQDGRMWLLWPKGAALP
ncbi:MAG: murein transglycosylase A [Burkholderiales bacterium]|nr:murein transglycosylase A [Burkholderiales bacterium]